MGAPATQWRADRNEERARTVSVSEVRTQRPKNFEFLGTPKFLWIDKEKREEHVNAAGKHNQIADKMHVPVFSKIVKNNAD